tara:strand:+ start:1218 stop:2009 length:792 start_codon:yes stop_codon:yes gene_type:complete
MVINEVKSLFKGTDDKQKDFGWYEFTLEELGLPSVDKILKGVKEIESKVGLFNWRTKHHTHEKYKGFGLTYNPNFFDKNESKYSQVWGSPLLEQYYGAEKGTGDHTQMKDTYYDTFGFCKIDETIQEHLGFFLDKFTFPISRSRVAYIFGYGEEPNKDKGWHVDEPTGQLLRINIPLQTSDEYVMEWSDKQYKLEIGKLYLWNTRMPHRPTMIRKVETKQPRINMVLGITPWLDLNHNTCEYTRNNLFGKPVNEIVKEKLFVK